MNRAVIGPTQKNLLAAIACYEGINFLALGPQPLLLQSSLNSTALRLKFAEAQPLQ